MAKNPTMKSVESLNHAEATRKNIPTAEHQSIMHEADKTPIRVAYERRNRDLDPQLVWRGKDEQDWSDLVVQAPPLYIQEKVHPKVLIDFLLEDNPEDNPTLIGINHGFSFPMRYFEAHHLEPDWPSFLADFRKHWPADEDDIYIDEILRGDRGNATMRRGHADWRRLTEERVGARSAFDFDAPGSVAKMTHAGIPWLLHVRDLTGGDVHFWPFDGWDIPAGRSAIVETWPALWNKKFARGDRTAGDLQKFLNPPLQPNERTIAEIEGWMLGVV